MFAFNHFNFNVTDLERSIAFYHDALGLEPVRRKEAADGSFILTFRGEREPFPYPPPPEPSGIRTRPDRISEDDPGARSAPAETPFSRPPET